MKRGTNLSKFLSILFSFVLITSMCPVRLASAETSGAPVGQEAPLPVSDTGAQEEGAGEQTPSDPDTNASGDESQGKNSDADGQEATDPAAGEGSDSTQGGTDDASVDKGSDTEATTGDKTSGTDDTTKPADGTGAKEGDEATTKEGGAQEGVAQGKDADKDAASADASTEEDKEKKDQEKDDKKDDKDEKKEEEKFPALQESDRSANGTLVSVSAPEGAFPEGTTLRVTDADSSGVLAAAGQMVGGQPLNAAAVDIAFVKDGQEVEPKAGTSVNVKMSLATNLDGPSDTEGGVDADSGDLSDVEPSDDSGDSGEHYVVVHVRSNGSTERMQASTATGDGAEFQATEFSVYGLAAVGPYDNGAEQLEAQSTADISVDGSVHAISRTGTPAWSSGAGGTQYTVSLSDEFGLWRFVARGAKGGSSSGGGGGAGGVTTVVEPMQGGDTYYVVTGGQGVNGRKGGSNYATTGGANGGGGGGNGRWRGGGPGNCSAGGSGGGATHIATTGGTLKDVAAGGSGSIVMVAGGGGGGGWNYGGGSGGGASGGAGGRYSGSVPAGTQTSGYEMGQGQDGIGGTYNVQRGSEGKGGGGGGYWGGTARNYGGRNSNASGAGGSGFLNGSHINGSKSGDGSSVTRDGITIATTSNGGGGGAGSASMEYLASIVELDKQDATEQGTKAVYAAPQSPSYYLSYSVNGLGNQSPTIEIPSRGGYSFEGYYTEPGFDIWTGSHDGDCYIDADGTISEELYKLGSTKLYAHMVPIWAMVTLDPGETSSAGTPAVYERYEHGIYSEKSATPTQVYTITIPERNCDITYDAANGITTRTNEKVSQLFYGYFDDDTVLIDRNGVIMEEFTNTRFTSDVTLEGKWQTASTTLPKATRDGFTFDGWYDKADGTRVGGADETYTPTKPTANLEAHWTPNIYTVTLDGKGATGPDNRTTAVYEKYDTGVYTDAACTASADTIVAPERKYTVTYDMTNGGSLPDGTASSETVAYQFDGYYTPQGGSTQLFTSAGAKTETFTNTFFGEDRTLNAHWTEKSCELPMPTAPEGKTFTGWSTDKDAHSGRTGSFTPTEDVTLYATYATTVYQIQYSGLDGVSGFNPPDAIGIAESEETWDTSFNVANPKRPGYAFTGWNISDMDGTTTHYVGDEGTTTTGTTYDGVTGTYFKNLRGTTGEVSFVAQWKPIATDVTLDGQGATTQGSSAVYEAYSQSIYKTKTETAGDPAYSDPMDPSGTPSGNAAIDLPQKVYNVTYDLGGKSGTLTDLTQPASYTFGGYYTDSNGKGQQLLTDQGKVTSAFTNTYFSPEAETPTLYAKWSGGQIQVRGNESTSEGYRFIGWSEDPDAETATYLPDDTLTPTAAMTLHAVYDQPTYVVSYSAHGGAGAPAPQSKVYNATLQLSGDIPWREESESDGAKVTFNANGGSSTGVEGDSITGIVDSTWSFGAWNTIPDGGTGGSSYDPGSDYTANEAATLHAQWQEHPTPRSITLPMPENEGYICQGWATTPDGGLIVGQPGQEYTPTANQTLYAQWTPTRYRVQFYDGEKLVKTSEEHEYGEVFVMETAESAGISKDGWKLEGWALEKDSLDVVYAAGVNVHNLAKTDSTVEVHAIWSRTLNFISGIGSPEQEEGTDELAPTSAASQLSAQANASLAAQSSSTTEVTQLSNGMTMGNVDTPELEVITGFNPVGWSASESDVTGKIDLEAETESPWTSDQTTFYGIYDRSAMVTYDGNGADGGATDASTGHQFYNASGELGKAVVTLADNGFTRKGFTFKTWSLGDPGTDYSWSAAVDDQATVTAKAMWVDNMEYLVKFDANGGEGTMEPQVMSCGVATKLNDNSFERPNYDFVAWNTMPNGSGRTINNGEEVTDLVGSGQEIVLYAQWQQKETNAAVTDLPKTGDFIGLGAIIAALLLAAVMALGTGLFSRRQRDE